jgi:hypothetical protein
LQDVTTTVTLTAAVPSGGALIGHRKQQGVNGNILAYLLYLLPKCISTVQMERKRSISQVRRGNFAWINIIFPRCGLRQRLRFCKRKSRRKTMRGSDSQTTYQYPLKYHNTHIYFVCSPDIVLVHYHPSLVR